MYGDLKSRGAKRKFGEDEEVGDNNTTAKVRNQREANTKVTQLLKNAILSTEKNVARYPLNGRNQCYTRQRHQIFSISMCKLNRFRQSPDPSLLRSVLICNTLRTLERELEREGIKINFSPNGVSFIPPIINPPNMTLDPPPSASLSANQNIETHSYFQLNSICETESNTNSSCEPDCYDRCLLDLDSSCGRVTPFLKQAYDRNNLASEFVTTQSSAFWSSDDNSDRLTNLNWSSVLNFNSTATPMSTPSTDSAKDDSSDSSACVDSDSTDDSSDHELASTNNSTNTTDSSTITSLTTLMSPTPSPTTSPPTASSNVTQHTSSQIATLPGVINNNSQNNTSNHHISLHNGNASPASFTNNNNIANTEEIFGDIDLSLYDFDLLSPLSPPNVKMAPVTAEELIKTITPNESNSSILSASSSSSPPFTSPTSFSSLSSSSSSSPISPSPSSPSSSPPSTCATSTSNSYHSHSYFKSSEKLFVEEKVMS